MNISSSVFVVAHIFSISAMLNSLARTTRCAPMRSSVYTPAELWRPHERAGVKFQAREIASRKIENTRVLHYQGIGTQGAESIKEIEHFRNFRCGDQAVYRNVNPNVSSVGKGNEMLATSSSVKFAAVARALNLLSPR